MAPAGTADPGAKWEPEARRRPLNAQAADQARQRPAADGLDRPPIRGRRPFFLLSTTNQRAGIAYRRDNQGLRARAQTYCQSMSLKYPDPDLTDGVVRLRRWRESDIDCIRQAAADPGIPEGTTVPAHCTPEAATAFIQRQWRRVETGEGLSMAIADAASDEALGLLWLGARPQAGVVGIGYWIVPGARRRGLAGHATRLATAWALDGAGMTRVEAWVEPANIASQLLLTSAGFKREGVLRSFLAFANRRSDAVVFSRISHDE